MNFPKSRAKGSHDGFVCWRWADSSLPQAATLTPRNARVAGALVLATLLLGCPARLECAALNTNGLVAWWTADGSALDAVGSHTGTLLGSAAFAPGIEGQAFAFNGVDSYVQVPDAPDLRTTNALSIAFWAKRQRFGIDIAVEKGDDWTLGRTTYGVGLHQINSNMFYFFFAGGWQGTPGVSDQDWHHYVVVAQQGQPHPRFYVDGAERAATYQEGAATISLFPSTQPVHLGAQVGNFNYFGQLLLDDVMLYSRALSSEEVQTLALLRVARLSISLLPAGVAVSWPTNYDTGLLEGKTSLSEAVQWVTVPGVPQISGTNFSLTTGTDAASHFYRLLIP